MIRTIPWPADHMPPGGGATDVWQPPPFVTILGDPADLYVCSDAPMKAQCHWADELVGWHIDPPGSFPAITPHTVVTGSTAPRAPLSAETLAELDRVHVAGSTSHIHLGDLR